MWRLGPKGHLRQRVQLQRAAILGHCKRPGNDDAIDVAGPWQDDDVGERREDGRRLRAAVGIAIDDDGVAEGC